MPVAERKSVKCYHCGEPCDRELIVFENKDFCCQGCKTVYEILKDNDLCDYYDLEKFPGTTLKDLQTDKFLFLNNSAIEEKLLDFASPELNKITFFVPKIHCSSCIWLLENLDRLNQGVISSRVNFVKKQVSVDYHPGKTNLKTLAEMLSAIGYEPSISLEDDNRDRKRSANTSLYIKIGVAGFCFGNIMLLSFPDYLGIDFLSDRSLKPFFSLLNILLILPVVFYSGVDYIVSAWKGLRQKFINIDVPITLGVIALFSRSLYEIIALGQAGYLDSLAGLIFFLLVGRWFQNKTYESLSFERDYKSYFPLAVIKEAADETVITQVNDLKKDDIILIRNQEIVPCDARLLEEKAFIDYSFVTGESRLVKVERASVIYAGGKISGETTRLQVIKEASQSYLTQLWNHDSFNKQKEPLSQTLINRVSRYFTAVVLAIAGAAFLFWAPTDISIAMNSFTAVLIVACPCALALSVPFTFGSVVRVFGKNEFYLKNAGVIEKLKNINHIVLDKTGTLTDNRHGEIAFEGAQLSSEDHERIAAVSFNSTHPMSRKIYAFCKKGGQIKKVAAFSEETGRGISGQVDGIMIKIGSASFAGGTDPEEKPEQSRTYLSINGKLSGYFEIRGAYRHGFETFLEKLKHSYNLSLLSGDSDHEKNFLSRFFDPSALHFNQRPDDKLQFIDKLQEKGENTLMVGDGLNDAGALMKSDAGVAVVEDASTFSPASDAILNASKFALLPDFLKFTHIAHRVVVASFIISFCYNIVGASFAVAGALTPVFAAILMPLSSISVVAFATGAVNLAARFKKLL